MAAAVGRQEGKGGKQYDDGRYLSWERYRPSSYLSG
jgi:hypothetical protein